MFIGESEGLLGKLVFAGERGVEHGWVVRVERDHHSMVEVGFRGMLGKARAKAGAQVASEADSGGPLLLCEFFDKIGIVEGRKAVADALGAQVERPPDRFRRAGFAGVGSQAQAVVSGPGVSVAKQLGRRFLLVASDADADDLAVVIADGQLEDFLRGLGPELAAGVEDPYQGDAEVASATGPAAIEALEDGSKILLTPEADSDRDVDLGVEHVFFFQPLHQAVSDEFVIVDSAQVLGDLLEGQQEPLKIFVAVECIDLGLGGTSSVAGSIAPSRCRCNSALGRSRRKLLGGRSGAEDITS